MKRPSSDATATSCRRLKGMRAPPIKKGGVANGNRVNVGRCKVFTGEYKWI